MNKNAMLVDHWEEFNQKRVEFRAMMKELIKQSFKDGIAGKHWEYTPEEYAEEKIKELF